MKEGVPFVCKYCGLPSQVDPSDQSPPLDICHEVDHESFENWFENQHPINGPVELASRTIRDGLMRFIVIDGGR